MLKSVNQSVSPAKLFDRLKQLGKCEYECSWIDDEDYYDNYIVSDTDIPELIRLATDIDYFSVNNDHFWIPIHAWRLIGRLKIREAIHPLINTLNSYPDIDWCKHELPHVFEMLEKDAIEPLASKLQDKSNTEMGQFLIVESLASIAHTNKSYRRNIIGILSFALDYGNKEAAYLNTAILVNLLSLGAIPTNVIAEVINGIIEEERFGSGLHHKYTGFDQYNFPFSTLPQGASKIGRNDKCPCGSGKKYKKCCMDIISH